MGSLFKFLVILVIVLYLMRSFFRLMYPRPPKQPRRKEIEMKACDYCGKLVYEDKGVQKRGRFFCSEAHKQRYF